MAKDRRWFAEDLEKAKSLIEEARSLLESSKDQAQEKYDNLPENFQNGEQGEKMQARIDAFEDAEGSLEDIASNLEWVE